MAGKAWKWSDYEQGRLSPRQGSVGSASSRRRIDENAVDTDPEALFSTYSGHDRYGPQHGEPSHGLGHRRSSVSMRINSLAQMGGVNSINNFARSWQRAVGFHDITPNLASFAFADNGDDTHTPAEHVPDHTRQSSEQDSSSSHPSQNRSLLSRQIAQAGSLPDQPETPSPPEQREQEAPLPQQPLLSQSPSRASRASRTSFLASSPTRDIFAHASHLAAPFSSSPGQGQYGSLASRIGDAGREDATRHYNEQQKTGQQPPDKEREPLLLRRVEEQDGSVGIEVIGQSTIYQTVLNSTNVLVGVGILSLPFGLRYAGWLVGLVFLAVAACVNVYTSRLLGRCLGTDRNLITFADLAYAATGPWGQLVIALMFMLELAVACVALFILFADSLDLLLPGWGILEFKVVCAAVMLPLSFVPLRLLGYTSSLGIVCCISIVFCVFIDGLIKADPPGSLRWPADTYLFPENWGTLPLSFGLLMAPWGGLAVFPNIFRDMRHAHKWNKSLNVTFGFTYCLDTTIAVVGLLMFGEATRNEITSNIFLTPGYPKAISYIISCCIAIIPITKIPLNARPIYSTIELVFGLGPREVPSMPGVAGMSGLARGLLKAAIRLVVTLAIMTIAILCPSFDRVMALMGSVFCYSICIVLPVTFYLRLFGKQISVREWILCWVLIVSASVLAIVGTVWAFLPTSVTGA